MCITDIIDDLYRLKSEMDVDWMRRLSMHGIDVKKNDYYNDLLTKQNVSKIKSDIENSKLDESKISEYMKKRATEWQKIQ